MKYNPDRRLFLKKMAAVAGGTALLTMQDRLQLIRAATAAVGNYTTFQDHKSLVCIFLYGGNDAFNMFVPYTNSAYQQYADVRQTMAIARNTLLPVADGQNAFHPSMPNVRDLYDQGKIGLVSNVGTLLEPVARSAILNGNARLPPDLYSHSHQTEMWMTGLPPETAVRNSGWGGRMFDLLMDGGSNSGVPPVFTLIGNNNWQTSENILPFSVNPWNGAESFQFLSGNSWPPWEASRSDAWEAILNLNSSNAMRQQASSSLLTARERIALLQDALSQAAVLQTEFNQDNYLAKQLEMTARLISVRELLGQKRQIYFVGLGGWDTHGQQLQVHADQLMQLDEAMFSFQTALGELGVEDSVTTFTASDFGRTLTANGDGTDHAWGSHALVMGAAVDGGRIHGRLPELELGGQDDAYTDGRIIPDTSLDQFGGTLGKWLGIVDADLDEIFPYLKNFQTRDLGFMA